MGITRTLGPWRVSHHGVAFIMREEGVVLHPYNDSRGFATIGVGHLLHPSAVSAADRRKFAKFMRDDALKLLHDDLTGTYAAAVNRAVRVPLSQAEFDALVSITYNIGVGGLESSSFLHALNAHHRGRVPGLMLLWSRPPELRGRRLREGALFRRARWT